MPTRYWVPEVPVAWQLSVLLLNEVFREVSGLSDGCFVMFILLLQDYQWNGEDCCWLVEEWDSYLVAD